MPFRESPGGNEAAIMAEGIPEALGPVLLPILHPKEFCNLLGIALSDKAAAHGMRAIPIMRV
jgi:hypothetical protein